MATKQTTLASNTHEPTTRELAELLSKEIEHKKDGFINRIVRRLSVGVAEQVEEENETHFEVSGSLDGDHYEKYSVDWSEHHLGMCDCYKHNFGTVRARKICTHVGAAIVRKGELLATDSPQEARDEMKEIGSVLNESAKRYINKRESIDTTVESLDIASKFSENWADRAARQATKMVETDDDSSWVCKGGENDGHTVHVGPDGYKCDTCDDKFPTPCKLGAYVLNNRDKEEPETEFSEQQEDQTDAAREALDIDSPTQFSEDDFKQMLKRTYLNWEDRAATTDEVPANFTQEIVYESEETVHTTNVNGSEHEFTIRLYTTVNDETKETRDSVEDTIRVCLYDEEQDAIVGNCEQTPQVSGAIKATQIRLEELEENTAEYLQICENGHLLVQRDGSNGRFYGCTRFPNCRESSNV